jgi:hypothetical protein
MPSFLPAFLRYTRPSLQLEMTTLRAHFAYRIDRWDISGETIIEHIAGIEDLFVAKAAYEGACQRWPGERITLRQGGRVIEDSSKTRLA